MASKTHNEKTALQFAQEFTRVFQTASPQRQQVMASALLEEMMKTPIDQMEGPSYLIAGYWEHLQEQAA